LRIKELTATDPLALKGESRRQDFRIQSKVFKKSGLLRSQVKEELER